MGRVSGEGAQPPLALANPPVLEEVRRGADQQRAAVGRLVQRADLLDPRAQVVLGDVVAEPVRGRVVGDGEEVHPALARRERHPVVVVHVGDDRYR